MRPVGPKDDEATLNCWHFGAGGDVVRLETGSALTMETWRRLEKMVQILKPEQGAEYESPAGSGVIKNTIEVCSAQAGTIPKDDVLDMLIQDHGEDLEFTEIWVGGSVLLAKTDDLMNAVSSVWCGDSEDGTPQEKKKFFKKTESGDAIEVVPPKPKYVVADTQENESARILHKIWSKPKGRPKIPLVCEQFPGRHFTIEEAADISNAGIEAARSAVTRGRPMGSKKLMFRRNGESVKEIAQINDTSVQTVETQTTDQMEQIVELAPIKEPPAVSESPAVPAVEPVIEHEEPATEIDAVDAPTTATQVEPAVTPTRPAPVKLSWVKAAAQRQRGKFNAAHLIVDAKKAGILLTIEALNRMLRLMVELREIRIVGYSKNNEATYDLGGDEDDEPEKEAVEASSSRYESRPRFSGDTTPINPSMIGGR